MMTAEYGVEDGRGNRLSGIVFSGEALRNCSGLYFHSRRGIQGWDDDVRHQAGDIHLFVLERYKEAQPCKEGRDGADQTRLGLESLFLDHVC